MISKHIYKQALHGAHTTLRAMSRPPGLAGFNSVSFEIYGYVVTTLPSAHLFCFLLLLSTLWAISFFFVLVFPSFLCYDTLCCSLSSSPLDYLTPLSFSFVSSPLSSHLVVYRT